MTPILERKRLKTMFTIIIVAILTIIAGEIKIVPFEDTTFRFGLGSIVFFLCILVLRMPIYISGILTAILIVPFRAMISISQETTTFGEQLVIHSPAAVFYLAYTIILTLLPIQHLKNKPFWLIVCAAISELLANCSEQIANALVFQTSHLQAHDLALLVAVAIFRSLFTVGLFSLISLSEQKKQTAQLLSIGSNLYTESLYVKKMMQQIEGITQDSFKLHQQLRKSNPSTALEALLVSQNIHEVKKDLQRVYAGLSKIVLSEQSNSYNFDDLLQLVVEANTSYSTWQQKDITIRLHHTQNFSTKEPFLLLSILNNIVANAIEAIEQQGLITISTKHTNNAIIINIENDGPTINEAALAIIFDAGYTTKFNKDGFASTGIGLNHVKTMCEKIGGSVTVTSSDTTIFSVAIPTYKILH